MSDDEGGPVDLRREAGDAHYGESLLYDFAKFMTTLSLLLLGGMLTLSGAAKAGDLKLINILFVSVAIAVSGMCAFATAYGIADARSRGREPARYLRTQMQVANACAGIGIGGFLMMWLDTLS